MVKNLILSYQCNLICTLIFQSNLIQSDGTCKASQTYLFIFSLTKLTYPISLSKLSQPLGLITPTCPSTSITGHYRAHAWLLLSLSVPHPSLFLSLSIFPSIFCLPVSLSILILISVSLFLSLF